MIPPFLKAKDDSLRLLSVCPRSVDELRKRLLLKKYTPSVVEELLESLQKQGLLNDARLAAQFAQSRLYSKPMGKKRLAFDLRKKGVPKAVVETALEGLGSVDERKIAKELVQNRFEKMNGVSQEKKKKRIFGFLARRGFENDVIFSVLSELFGHTDHENG